MADSQLQLDSLDGTDPFPEVVDPDSKHTSLSQPEPKPPAPSPSAVVEPAPKPSAPAPAATVQAKAPAPRPEPEPVPIAPFAGVPQPAPAKPTDEPMASTSVPPKTDVASPPTKTEPAPSKTEPVRPQVDTQDRPIVVPTPVPAATSAPTPQPPPIVPGPAPVQTTAAKPQEPAQKPPALPPKEAPIVVIEKQPARPGKEVPVVVVEKEVPKVSEKPTASAKTAKAASLDVLVEKPREKPPQAPSVMTVPAEPVSKVEVKTVEPPPRERVSSWHSWLDGTKRGRILASVRDRHLRWFHRREDSADVKARKLEQARQAHEYTHRMRDKFRMHYWWHKPAPVVKIKV